MKKLLLVTAIFFISSPVMAAQSIKVSALTPFNSLRPVKEMKVMALEHVEFKNGIVFEDGTIIYGNIIDVKQPKRAKLNASFKFQPTAYLYKGKTYKIEDPEFIAKYAQYKELDKAGIATSAATTAGGLLFHIPLLSQGVSLVKGMWKNNENNRLKSGVVQVYKDSPLSYIEEGQDVVIEKDTIFKLKFKSSDAEDLDENSESDEDIHEDTNTPDIPLNKTEVIMPQEANVNSIQTIHPEEVLQEVEAAQAAQQKL